MWLFVKKNFKYILLFFFFFLCMQFFYCAFQGDLIYNFGFSYAIARGEIPYHDFNMIIPPFSAFLYAIPLLLFGSNLIIFNLFQSFLLCIFFGFLFRLFDKRAWLFLPILCMCIPIPFATILFAGYNFLLLFVFVILLYLEKNHGNDYLIGILLGISILIKQTVGFCFALVSFYYLFKDYKKVFKRIIGFFLPCIIFLIYLLVTNSFMNFLDMCFFGMFDFTKSNGKIWDYNFLLFLLEVFVIFIKIFKDKKNINHYYALAFSSIAIPLFDYYHVALLTFAFLMLFFDHIKISFSEFSLGIHCFFFALSLSLIWFGFNYDFSPNVTNFRNFEGKIMSKDIERETKKINQYIKDNKDKNLIILGANAYFFKITNDMDINYYDLLNYGNHGYHGTDKVIKRIQEEKYPIFIINIKEYQDNSSDRQQINKDVMRYVIHHYHEKQRIGEYIIYTGA